MGASEGSAVRHSSMPATCYCATYFANILAKPCVCEYVLDTGFETVFEVSCENSSIAHYIVHQVFVPI
jgi:hypothetical protein